MTIYPDRPSDFTCAICLEPGGPDRWCWAGDYPIPPLCRDCARTWGLGGGQAFGGYGDRNRDRRIARQISALANVLSVEAHRIGNGKGTLYGRA